MPDFDDLFLRQSLTQPAPQHYGGWASPDIVPWGATENPDPAALAGTMTTDPGHPLVPDRINYAYLRTRNADPRSDRIGRLFLGTQPPTYLPWPDALTPIPGADGQAYFQLGKIAPGAVGVATSPFAFTPSTSGDALCGWVFTRDHPVTPPALRSITELGQFLASTPGYAQRSVGFGTAADGSRHFIGSYQQRDQPASVQFAIQTTDCTGCRVALDVVDGGDKVRLRQTTVPSDNFGVALDADLPAGYEATLDFAIDTAGATLRPTSRMRVGVLLRTDDPSAAQSLIPLAGHEWRSERPG